MMKSVGSSICLAVLLGVCSVSVADSEEARPLETLVKVVRDGAKAIGNETQAAARDVFVLARDDAAYLGTYVKQAPAEIGAAARNAGPDLVESVEGFLRSPDDQLESTADWLLEPLDVLVGDDLF